MIRFIPRRLAQTCNPATIGKISSTSSKNDYKLFNHTWASAGRCRAPSGISYIVLIK